MTSSGPGATNLITALATAYADSIPLIAITGQVNSNLLGRDVFQEADMRGSTESFVKYSYLVKTPTIFRVSLRKLSILLPPEERDRSSSTSPVMSRSTS